MLGRDLEAKERLIFSCISFHQLLILEEQWWYHECSSLRLNFLEPLFISNFSLLIPPRVWAIQLDKFDVKLNMVTFKYAFRANHRHFKRYLEKKLPLAFLNYLLMDRRIGAANFSNDYYLSKYLPQLWLQVFSVVEWFVIRDFIDIEGQSHQQYWFLARFLHPPLFEYTSLVYHLYANLNTSLRKVVKKLHWDWLKQGGQEKIEEKLRKLRKTEKVEENWESWGPKIEN